MGTPIHLTQFGWDNIIIPGNLKELCKYLPKWNQLKSLRNAKALGSHFIHFPHTFFYDMSGTPYMPALEKGELDNDDGGYSLIFKAQRSIYKPQSNLSGTVSMVRKTSFAECCIKEIALKIEDPTKESEYLDEIKAIMYEAFLHALVDITLERNGLNGFVPRLHEVLATTVSGEPITVPKDITAIWMVMEFMDGTTLEKYLNYKFGLGTKESNSRLLKDILIQLVYMLHILEKSLLFNHRDLKLNNLYVRYHSSPGWKRKLNVYDLGELEFQTDLVMIDFGFSCIACGTGFTNPKLTLFGAGSYFSPDDDCLKTGRDLAQFLYSLHCCFPLQKFINKPLFDFIHSAVVAEKRGILGTAFVDLYKGIDASGRPISVSRVPESITYNDGIYAFLKESGVDVPGCASERFIRGLHALSF
jgi:serine/threonine protein kinase